MTINGGVTSAGRPLIIPIFIPHMGCPHRCVFCNQRTITGKPEQVPSPQQLHRKIRRFLKYGQKRPSTTQIAFFGGNFLGLEKAVMHSLLGTAASFVLANRVDSIRFSTRPDTVIPEKLSLLEDFPISTVELGVQSMNDHVLRAAGRGHRATDTGSAVDLLKRRGYQVGLQMMVGLPADDDDGAMETARRIVALQPEFVRIYPTLVLKGSSLAQRLKQGRYHPLGLTACVSLVKRLYLYFKTHSIPVIRMGLQSSNALTQTGHIIAGPYHPAFGHLVHAEVAFDAISSALGRMERLPDPLSIVAPANMISRVQGLNKQNFTRLKTAFGLKSIHLIQDTCLPKNHLVVGKQRVIVP